jgi:hypothetical protein
VFISIELAIGEAFSHEQFVYVTGSLSNASAVRTLFEPKRWSTI